MHVGHFAPYTSEAEREHRRKLDLPTPSGTIFSLLSMPFFSSDGSERTPRIGPDKERPKKLKRVRRALRTLMDETVDESVTMRRLKFSGGELILEDEAYKVLCAVWAELRAGLPDSMCEEAVDVDEWLEQMKEYTEDEWKKELEQRAAAPQPA